MASFSSYAPNETQSTIIQEETWLQGALLATFFFGIQTTLSVLAFFAVLRRRDPEQSRLRIMLSVYIALLFAITTTAQGLALEWIQMGFITQRNYPGGPSAFLNNGGSTSFNLAADLLPVCANWMMESLLVWRCYVVCSTGERLLWFGIVIPLLLLLAVIVTGTLFVIHTLHTAPPVSYVLAYSISSFALNVIATGFIAGRLLVYRHRMMGYLGRGHGRHYVGIAAVVIESAAIYTGFLLIVIVASALTNSATNLLQQIAVPIQAITSLLIIWRVARGQGWSKSTDTEMVSTMEFSSNTRSRPQSRPGMIRSEATLRPDEEEGGVRRKVGDREILSPEQGKV